MDALALFCNLHGNGPETLAALRDAGCERLGQVVEMEVERLEALLGRDAIGVARFQREAAVLARRVDGELGVGAGPKARPVVEPEPESSVLKPAVREVRANDLDRERALLEALDSRPVNEPDRSEPVHEQEEQAVAQVEPIDESVAEQTAEPIADSYGKPVESEAASRADRIAQLASPKEPSMGPVATAVIDLWRSLDQPAVSAATPKDATAGGVDQPLSELEGLSGPVIDAMARIGIESVAMLAAADPLELARRTTLAYTHLAHVTFLARRARDAGGELVPEPSKGAEPQAAVQLSGNDGADAEERPEAGSGEEHDTPSDAGGPFA